MSTNKDINKNELLTKLNKLDAKKIGISFAELEYLKSKIYNDSLGLVLNFEDREEIISQNNYLVLEEIKELNVNLSTTKEQKNNILIEGDNYHSLKALITANVKVDVIYIDPPYNTGNKDFIYNDTIIDKDDQYRHSKWLSFMKKRLKLAKELLSDDGVIFISIDGHEQAYLKVLMDEIFWEENFIGCWPRLKSTQGKNDSKSPISKHEFILIYSKNKEYTAWNKKDNDPSYFIFDDNDGRGPYHLKNYISATEGLGYVESLDFEIEINGEKYLPISNDKKTRWLWSKDRIEAAKKLNILVPKGPYVYSKKYLNYEFDKNNELVPKKSKIHFDSLQTLDNIFSNKQGTKDLEIIMGGKGKFDFPKPVSLIKFLVNLIDKKESLILDFFAGSGTTGQAIMELNEEDGGNRRFILCTNNENDIAKNICRERIHRVINGFGSNGEKIDWEYSKDKKSLSNNSLRYLKVKEIDKYDGDFEELDDIKELYKIEFDKEISIKDFSDNED